MLVAKIEEPRSCGPGLVDLMGPQVMGFERIFLIALNRTSPKTIVGQPNVIHPKWSTLSAVAYTQRGLYHQAWSTPPAVACTQSGLHHQAWSLPFVTPIQAPASRKWMLSHSLACTLPGLAHSLGLHTPWACTPPLLFASLHTILACTHPWLAHSLGLYTSSTVCWLAHLLIYL